MYLSTENNRKKLVLKKDKLEKNRSDIEWRVSHEASFWNTCLFHVIAFWNFSEFRAI